MSRQKKDVGTVSLRWVWRPARPFLNARTASCSLNHAAKANVQSTMEADEGRNAAEEMKRPTLPAEKAR